MAKNQIVSPVVARVNNHTMLLVSFVLAFLFYANTFKNGFSLDDELVMTTDRHAHEVVEKGIGGIKEIFTTNYAVDGKQNYEYRPIVTLSYAIEWSLFSENPDRVNISHFINVLLYGLCGYLLFVFLNSLTQGKQTFFSALVVVLFLIHPIHSEVVNNLKNRDEMLSFIFAMLAAIQVFKWVDKQHWKHLFFGLIFLVISVLSKKSNLPFMAIIPVMLYFFRDISFKKIGLAFGVLIFAQIIYRAMKLGLVEADLNRKFSYLENPLYEMGFIDRIPVFFQTNLFYIQKLLFPYPLHFYYGYNALPVATFKSLSFILGLVVMLGLLFLVLKGLKDKTWYSFAILFFLMAIGGAGNLLTPMVGIVAERFVFTASIGFCFGMVGLFFWLTKTEREDVPKFQMKPAYFVLALTVPFFIYSVQRNKDWFSKMTLYAADVKTTSTSSKVNSLIATELQEEAFKLQKQDLDAYEIMMQKVDSAIEFYSKSVSIFNRYESNWNNRGTLQYTFYFDYPAALYSFQQSVKHNDQYYEGFLNIANAYAKMAEGYDNFLPFLPSTNSKASKTKRVDEVFREMKLYRSFSVIRKYQANAVTQIKAGFDGGRANLLFRYAQRLEKLDPLVQQLQFSSKMGEAMNYFLQTKTPPNILAIENIRKSVTQKFVQKLGLSEVEVAENVRALKQVYLDSAKVYFDKTYEIKPKLESLYYSVDQFAMLLQDYNLLVDIQLKFLKHFKKKYNAPTYIQLANGNFNLGKMDEAKKYFKLGTQDLNAELDELNKLGSLSAEQQQRKTALETEIYRLNVYVQKIRSGEIIAPQPKN